MNIIGEWKGSDSGGLVSINIMSPNQIKKFINQKVVIVNSCKKWDNGSEKKDMSSLK